MGKYKTSLTERDIKIFKIIKKFGWLREDYLAKYIGLNWDEPNSRTIMYNLAFRLKKNNFIVKEKIIEGYPAYWTLGKTGARFISTDEAKKLSLVTLIHNDTVADLAIDNIIKNPNIELITEYELKQTLFGSNFKNKKLPDLVIDKNTAIEIELSKKNDAKLANIITNYIESQYEEIIYYITHKSIANKINYFAKDNNRFKFRLFKESNILEYENYTPTQITMAEIPRDDKGKFINSAQEKLKQIGAFD